MESLPILIRLATDRDVPFITNSWVKSFRNSKLVDGVPNRIYSYYHHKILEDLLPRCTVLIACNEQDDDQLVAHCCAEVLDTALVIHYIYVKERFRGNGLARKMVETLLEHEPNVPAILYTHQTRVGKKIISLKKDEFDKPVLYNPYLLFVSLPQGWQNESRDR